MDGQNYLETILADFSSFQEQKADERETLFETYLATWTTFAMDTYTHTHSLSLFHIDTRAHTHYAEGCLHSKEKIIFYAHRQLCLKALTTRTEKELMLKADFLHCKKVFRFSVEFQLAEYLQQYLYLSWGEWECYTIE